MLLERSAHAGFPWEPVAATLSIVTPVHPKKLLRSKWTAVFPVDRQKHFLVTDVHSPDSPQGRVEWVEVEAVLTRAVHRIDWRDLQDDTRWRQGWTPGRDQIARGFSSTSATARRRAAATNPA